MKKLAPLAIGICALVLAGGQRLRAGGVVADGREQTFRIALAGGGDVTFSANAFITLTSSILIQTNTAINANGHTVFLSGGNTNTLFIVASGVNFTNNGLTLRNGLNTNGGALYINSNATVVLTNCVLSGNSAAGTNGSNGTNGIGSGTIGRGGRKGAAGGNGLGGAIYNLGSLIAFNCAFSTNTATGGNGGNGGSGAIGSFLGGNGAAGGNGGIGLGGGIYNLGTLDLENCSFAANSASGGDGGAGGGGGSGPVNGLPGNGGAGGVGSGAGLYSFANRTTNRILSCTFSDNAAQGGNGASGGSGIGGGRGNSGKAGAEGSGGGIWNSGTGILALTNCTFFRDNAIGGSGGNGGEGSFLGGKGGSGGNGIGGGLYNTGKGSVFVVNCTFSSGSAIGGTNGSGGGGGAFGSGGSKGKSRGGNISNGSKAAAFVLKNSIVGTNFSGGGGYGSLTDAGNNISADKSITLKSSTSLVNTDPELGSFANNGGPTATMPLLTTNSAGIKTNSPAIDKIAATNAPSLDQRGAPRPFGSASDIGAYEEQLLFIQTQPQSQSQTNGGAVTFTIDVLGDAPLNYQWRLGGTNILGANQNTFTIANVAGANAGSYDVTVSNISGSVTSVLAVLTVNFPPSITAQPTNLLVLAGSPVSFSVTATGDAPLIYQWQLNGTNISGATNPVYSIVNAQSTNAGTYAVSITNAFGSITSAPAVLSIGVPPSIITQPVNQTATLGSNVTFSVIAGGSSSLTYQWRFNLTNINDATGPTYGKSSVQLKDAGSYDVVVGNNFGTVESAPASLIVVAPAPLLVQPALVVSNFDFVFQTQTGFEYVVEFKNLLTDPVWTPLTTNAGTGKLMTNSAVIGSESSGFFRVRVQ